MKERLVQIRRDTGFQVSKHKLPQIYKTFGIRLKNVKAFPKVFTETFEKKRKQERKFLAKQLKKCEEKQIPIYYLDETVFVIK